MTSWVENTYELRVDCYYAVNTTDGNLTTGKLLSILDGGKAAPALLTIGVDRTRVNIPFANVCSYWRIP